MTPHPLASRASGLALAAALALGLAAPTAAEAAPAAAANGSVQAPECRDCHNCAAPTPANPCFKTCPRLLAARNQSSHGLAEAPDVLLINKLADQYAGVQFNHKLHAGMSEMGQGCSVCHHFCPPGKIPPCAECHAAAATTAAADLRQPGLKGAYHRQCLQCHREWSHETDCTVCHLPKAPVAKGNAWAGIYMGANNDATDIMGKPHPKLTEPGKRVYVTPYAKGPTVTFHHQQHVELFGLKCVNCHQKEGCASCHDLKKPASTKKSMEEVHAVCSTSCHKNDKCERCHDTKERPGFTHASTGWPLNRYHERLECRACHSTGKPIQRLNRECTACHAGWKPGGFRHAVTGLVLDETHSALDCTDCHANAKFGVAPQCASCHDDGRDAKKAPPGKRIK